MKSKKSTYENMCSDTWKIRKERIIKVVRDNEGNVFVDETGKANGRGAYIKKDRETIEKARKSKILERHLEVTIKDEIYDELLTKI